MVGFVCVVGGGWLISLLYFGGLWFCVVVCALCPGWVVWSFSWLGCYYIWRSFMSGLVFLLLCVDFSLVGVILVVVWSWWCLVLLICFEVGCFGIVFGVFWWVVGLFVTCQIGVSLFVVLLVVGLSV